MSNYILNEEQIFNLTLCWPEALGASGTDALEACLHEIAHVLSITNEPFHYGWEPSHFIATLKTSKAQDLNEVRSSAAAFHALEILGFLTPKLINIIEYNLYANLSYCLRDSGAKWWVRMRDSKRSKSLGKKLAKLMIDLGIVEKVS